MDFVLVEVIFQYCVPSDPEAIDVAAKRIKKDVENFDPTKDITWGQYLWGTWTEVAMDFGQAQARAWKERLGE